MNLKEKICVTKELVKYREIFGAADNESFVSVEIKKNFGPIELSLVTSSIASSFNFFISQHFCSFVMNNFDFASRSGVTYRRSVSSADEGNNIRLRVDEVCSRLSCECKLATGRAGHRAVTCITCSHEDQIPEDESRPI